MPIFSVRSNYWIAVTTRVDVKVPWHLQLWPFLPMSGIERGCVPCSLLSIAALSPRIRVSYLIQEGRQTTYDFHHFVIPEKSDGRGNKSKTNIN